MAELHPIVREIKKRRIALGLTQTSVAINAGVSKTLVCEVEAGLHKPGLDSLVGMARAVGLVLSLELDTQRHQPVEVCRICHQPWPCADAGRPPDPGGAP